MALTKQKFAIVELVVEGSGDFPVDMLRYDSCTPWSEEDSHSIASPQHLTPRRIHLRRFLPEGRTAANAATVGRWDSFGWKVVEVNVDGLRVA